MGLIYKITNLLADILIKLPSVTDLSDPSLASLDTHIYTGTDLSALNSTTGGAHNIPRDKAAIILGPLWLMGIPQDAFITICLDRVVNDLETKFHIFNLLVYGMELFHYLNYDGTAEAS